MNRRLLYILNARFPTERAYGAQVMKTCEALARRGYDLELVAPARRRSQSITEDAFAYYGVKRTFAITTLFTPDLVRFGRAGFWASTVCFALRSTLYVRTQRPDMVYGRDEVSLLCARLFCRRVFWESHTGRYNVVVRTLFAWVRGVVVISEGLRAHYISLGVPGDMVCTAHDGVDITALQATESREAARARLGLSPRGPVVLYIGSLAPRRGHETFLEAAALMPEITSAVIGDTLEDAPLTARYPFVRFLGRRPYRELGNNQAAADILVAPSTGKDAAARHFVSPLKMFAYMASGVPIVAGDTPAMREVLSESLAYLVPPDNAQALAFACQSILTDYAAALARAERAREAVAAYTWDARASALAAFMEARMGEAMPQPRYTLA